MTAIPNTFEILFMKVFNKNCQGNICFRMHSLCGGPCPKTAIHGLSIASVPSWGWHWLELVENAQDEAHKSHTPGKHETSFQPLD